MSRAVHPQISFADWELMRQGLVLEPVLQAIADFLDDHEGMIEAIRDLQRTEEPRHWSQRIERATSAGLADRDAGQELGLSQFASGSPRVDAAPVHRLLIPPTGSQARCIQSWLQSADAGYTQSRQRPGDPSGGRSRIGGRHQAACRHHGRANRHPSPDRQHVIMGCGARRHALGRPPCQSAGSRHVSRVFAIAPGRHGVGCTKYNA